MNKILGSSKYSVSSYFFLEGFIIILATLLFTLLFAIPANSLIEQFAGLNLLHGNTLFIISLVLLFSLLSLFFGMLPVLKSVFSLFHFSASEKNLMAVKSGGFSRGLIVFQYAFSIALISAVLVISRQTNFAYKNGMGVQENNIICMESVHANIQQKFEVFKEELLKYNSIQSVSAMMEPPGGEANDMFAFELEGYKPNKQEEEFDRIGVFPCDYSFASIFNLQFLSGVNFTEKNTDADGSGEYIINEAAMRRLNHSNPNEIVGKEFILNFSQGGDEVIKIPRGKIIGVVKDFHLSSLKKEVEPLVLFKRENLWLINFVVSYRPEMQDAAINDMSKVWNSLFPEFPFQYKYVGAMYQQVYKSEFLQAKLLSVFTIIALLICSMGLFGLALIVTRQRIKEIGVRKVNGAKELQILTMLNRDFVKWVVIAFVIATPVAYYTMHKWLENFAYKTSLSWWIFALAGFLALGIALLTVSFQSWKAAKRNPVEALRYE
jgi:putative ABC transport system permease protein